MFDIDKYKGHTPIWYLWGETGAWWVQSDFTTHDDFVVAEVQSQNEVDARLIADAPLILEAYKELQDYHAALLHWVMYHLDKDEDEVKEMIYE